MQYSFLFGSDEFKLFLRGTGEFRKLISTLSLKEHHSEILLRYSTAFGVTESGLEKHKEVDYVPILDFNNILISMLATLDNMAKFANDNKEMRKRHNNLYSMLVIYIYIYIFRHLST